MISSLSLRPAAQRARPSTRARASARSMATARVPSRPARAQRGTAAVRTPARAHRGTAAVRTPARARPQKVTWETRTFGVTALAIAAGFLLAVVYLGQITGVSANDYEMQRLAQQRAELQRQSALLDVQLAKLESPARVEAQAARLGLLRLSHVPVMSAQELAARK